MPEVRLWLWIFAKLLHVSKFPTATCHSDQTWSLCLHCKSCAHSDKGKSHCLAFHFFGIILSPACCLHRDFSPRQVPQDKSRGSSRNTPEEIGRIVGAFSCQNKVVEKQKIYSSLQISFKLTKHSNFPEFLQTSSFASKDLHLQMESNVFHKLIFCLEG